MAFYPIVIKRPAEPDGEGKKVCLSSLTAIEITDTEKPVLPNYIQYYHYI